MVAANSEDNWVFQATSKHNMEIPSLFHCNMLDLWDHKIKNKMMSCSSSKSPGTWILLSSCIPFLLFHMLSKCSTAVVAGKSPRRQTLVSTIRFECRCVGYEIIKGKSTTIQEKFFKWFKIHNSLLGGKRLLRKFSDAFLNNLAVIEVHDCFLNNN